MKYLQGLLGTALIVAEAHAHLAHCHHFDVKAGDLRDSLAAWSRQSGEEFLYDYNAVRGHGAAVHGYLEDSTALQIIIGDTGYTYDVISNRAVAIVPIPACAPEDPEPPTPPCYQVVRL